MAPPMVVTEDTPPDMLAGSMDLCVVLPDGHSLSMSVDRSTPMMDLLVQVTTANKMSPAGFIIKPHNDRGPLPYKPSTPIGALDAWTIHVVPKLQTQCTAVKRPLKTLNQPFEQTFRLQVHLPRNQLYVARVSPRTRLADILLQVCAEKNLDPIKYSLRHPNNLDQVLNVSCSLADYKLQEVTLVSNRSRPVEVSAVDIMSLQRDNNNPAYRNNLCEGSVSSGSLEGRSLSPAPSDESSASPPPPPPSRPTRKRRPAPKPPITVLKPPVEEQPQLQSNGVSCSTATTTTINHSRNSSDSSGYHEASVLSESPQTNCGAETLAQRKMAAVVEATPNPSSLQQAAAFPSTTSLSSITGRKKKSAPPPPTVTKNRASSLIEDTQRTPSVSSTASSTTTLDGNEGTTGFKSATLPPSSRLNCGPPPDHPTPSTPQVSPAPRSRPRPVSALLESALARPRHTKCPAPQPLPRTLAPSKSVDDSSKLDKRQESLEGCPKQQPTLSDRPLQKSVFSSHKACIAEMAFKFDRSKSTIEHEEGSEVSNETDKEASLKTEVSKPLEKMSDLDNGLSIEEDKTTVTTAWVKGSISESDGTALDTMADEEIDRIFTNATENHTSPEIDEVNLAKLPTPPPSMKQSSRMEESVDWEYQLPAPPTFRDEARSPSVTEFATVTIGHLEDVLCSDIAQEPKINGVEEDLVEVKSVTPESEKVEDCVKLNCEVKSIHSVSVSESIASHEDNVSVTDSTASHEDNKPVPMVNQTTVTAIPSRANNLKELECNVMKELTSTLSRHSSKVDINICMDTEYRQELTTSSTLDNFKLTTYKDTKPVEVFEDDSIKSSAGEKRDKSKDDAVFRAPKARVKEPHLSRRSSFNVDKSGGGPLIKRSVSYVSLLAANMPRNSQPYRAILQLQRTDDDWPRLRKTTSELNIDNQGRYLRWSDERLTGSWKDDSTELQSVQVLRKILSRSHANLSNLSEPPAEQKQSDHIHEEKSNHELGEEADTDEWGRSKSGSIQDFCKEERNEPVRQPESVYSNTKAQDHEFVKPYFKTIRGPPAINLSTWSERPKRQVSIKNDRDYIFGSRKKSTSLDEDNTDNAGNENVSTDFDRSVQVQLVDSFKQDAKSRSTSDLSRIPIVRSVELKKPFTAHHMFHTPLKPVPTLEDIKAPRNVVNSKTPPLSVNDEEENFVGVNSLARRFGVPQKRPVSMYSNITYLSNNNNDSIPSQKNVFSQKINHEFINNETRNTDSQNVLVDSNVKATGVHHRDNSTASQIKALSRTRSGGLTKNNVSIVGISAKPDSNHSSCTYLSNDSENSMSQPIYRNSLEQVKVKSVNSTVNSNCPQSTLSQPYNVTQRLSIPGAYVCQSQTVEKRERINLQPVVKGFRTAGESKNQSSLPVQTKDTSSQSDLCKKINVNNTYKASSYNRALSTPNISSSSLNNKDSTKEAVVIVPSSSNNGVSEAVVRTPPTPPAPPVMPVLKPVGERKGVKLLPPPEAKPRDQLMESIRGFGTQNLKKVTTKYSAPLYL